MSISIAVPMEMQRERGGKRRERIVVKHGKKLGNLSLGTWEIFILILQF